MKSMLTAATERWRRRVRSRTAGIGEVIQDRQPRCASERITESNRSERCVVWMIDTKEQSGRAETAS